MKYRANALLDGNGVRTNCVDLFEFMDAYENVVQRVGKSVYIGIITSMVDATNEI